MHGNRAYLATARLFFCLRRGSQFALDGFLAFGRDCENTHNLLRRIAAGAPQDRCIADCCSGEGFMELNGGASGASGARGLYGGEGGLYSGGARRAPAAPCVLCPSARCVQANFFSPVTHDWAQLKELCEAGGNEASLSESFDASAYGGQISFSHVTCVVLKGQSQTLDAKRAGRIFYGSGTDSSLELHGVVLKNSNASLVRLVVWLIAPICATF
jgi:hypothetical protein